MNFLFSLLLIGFLGAALYLLSRNAEQARQSELEALTLLTPSDGTEEEDNPFRQETPPAEDPFGGEPLHSPDDTSPTATPATSFPPAGIPPTPTPLPAPTPTPTPVPLPPTPVPPTPTPSILDTKDQVKEELRRELDLRVPLAQTGEMITLTLETGRQIEGTLLQTERRQFKIESAIGSQWIPYRRLNLESRLRVDASERETFLEEKALEQILNRR
jgi:hypothetical protein